jgi:hypothetical protein
MELPDFESLKYLAEENPEALEQLRQRYCRELIDSAPERFRRKLAGLLFRIDMESRLSRNSIQRCIRLSQMMMESFTELQDALKCSSRLQAYTPKRASRSVDNIIQFPRK